MIEINLRLVGVLLLVLTVSQPFFFRHFKWRAELMAVSLLTRQVFLVHAVFIGLVIGMMGVLSLVFTPLLLERTPLARLVLGGMALFWAVRVAMQFFVYDSKLWRGDRARTFAHVFFAALYTYFAVTFAMAMF